MIKQRQYDLIDLLKLIACFCVVGIHTGAPSDLVSENMFYMIEHCVYRLAVPFFFVVSGFFGEGNI